MNLSAYALLVYGFFVFIGGMIGYAKAHSLPSLVVGVVSAIILIASSIAMFKQSILGAFVGIALTILLALFFSYRYIQSYKFMPAGLMVLLSLIVIVIFIATKAK